MSDDQRAQLDQQRLTARLYREHGRPFGAGGLPLAAGLSGLAAGAPVLVPQLASQPGALGPHISNMAGAGPRGQRAALAARAPKNSAAGGLFHDPRQQQQQQAALAAAAARPDTGMTAMPGKRGQRAAAAAAAAASAEEKESASSGGYNTASTLAAPLLSAQGTPLPAPGTFLVAPQRRARSVQPKDDPSLVEVPDALKPLLGDKLSLRTPAESLLMVQEANRAEFRKPTAPASGGASNAFSRMGQLPRSKAALQALKSSGMDPNGAPFQRALDAVAGAGGKAAAAAASAASASSAGSSTGAAASTTAPVLDASAQYEKYLMSPFSFIDKAIDSPYTDEYVYLNPRGPYDLVIVKHDRIDPANYYTMSRAGVTHFVASETDFTSLDQWEREYFLFTKMMEIPFFRRFRMWKAFYFWKKYIRRTKLNKCKKVLTENLYILNPNLRPSLVALKALCYAASKWVLFKVDPRHTLNLVQFCANQEAQKQVVVDSLNKLFHDVRRIVAEACEVDLKQFLINNGFRQGRKNAADPAAGDAKGEDDALLGLGGAGGGGGSDDNPQKISHAEKAANRTKCRSLTKFIRLADYLVIDTLVTLSMDRTQDVLNFVQRKPANNQTLQATKQVSGIKTILGPAGAAAAAAAAKPTSGALTAGGVKKAETKKVEEEELPLFQVELELENQAALAQSLHNTARDSGAQILAAAAAAASKSSDADEFHMPSSSASNAGIHQSQGLMFTPALEQWQNTLEASIDSAIRKIMTPKRLIHDPDFAAYTRANVGNGDGGAGDASEGGSGGGGGGEDGNDFKLESMVLDDPGFLEVKSGIKVGLGLAFQAAGIYAKSFEPLRDTYLDNLGTDVSAFADAPIAVFADLIHKYEAQIREFSKMATSANIGIVQVDSSGLKNLFLPSPKQRLSEIEKLLPAVAREKCRELLEKLRDASARISQIPATVEEFVEIMSFLAKIHEAADEDHQRYLFIQDLYNLHNEHKIRVPESDKAAFEKLTQTRQTFKTAILLSESGVNSNTERFSKELEAEIPLLTEDVKLLVEELKDESLSRVDSDLDEVIAFLEARDEALVLLEEKAQRFQYYQDVLQVEVVQYEELREARADLDVKLSLWQSLKTWGEATHTWMNARFDRIDVEEIAKQVAIYNKVYSKAKRMLVEGNAVVALLRDKISEFQFTLPVVSDLRNPDLQKHHWDAITKLLGHDVQADQNFTLGTLISLNAMAHKAEISIISNKAAQEQQLNQLLQKVIGTWSELSFPVVTHKDAKDVYILGNLDDILAALDDTLVTINTIMGSRFVDPIRAEVDDWNHKLMLFQDTLDEWGQVQRQWLYLESIFASQDIVRQLPDEFTMFSKVDRAWKEIMRRTNDNPNAIVAGTYPGLRDNLHNYNAILDRVQKQLESYLETRRQQFPRFYFISNDELLAILANSKSLANVQPHLRKLFEAIYALEFQDKDIKAMLSPEGERVPLGMNLKARGSAEVWLPALEGDMVKSLRRYMKRGVTDYERMARRDWVLDKFAQVVCTVGQIAWTRGCEQAISDKNARVAVARWYDAQIAQLSELTAMVRGNLSPTDRKKIVALITQDVHGRDVVAALRDEQVSTLHNFTWQQQLRFYWSTDEDDCIVRQSNAQFLYGYEYMGITTRLVITPLTDRAWMTITGALHIRFGAAPAGPAGTGKTESTKDLAKALGIFCVVFNCSEQINYKTMAKLFSGLAQAGAWTCLDEFNRIDIEVLSVIAQQLLQVRQALLVGASDFLFQGTQIRLKPTFGCMITMNPELPDNLKVLFRPVSMMIPDYALIAELMLFAEGFDTAQVLSKKMVKLYKLASEQLSQQDHYDFGMRAVKSVLVMAGALKRAEPDLDESIVLVNAMRNSNVPKFLVDDLPLFGALIQDLFPGLDLPESDYGELDTAIRHAIAVAGLQPVPGFITKVAQLYDTFAVRFGVMIVGAAGAGKSACHDVLAKALTALREAGSTNEHAQFIHTHTLNPKCITMDELYGSLSPMTGEWVDGLGSSIIRFVCTALAEQESAVKRGERTHLDRHIITFDGPVDALWIENMNTVLDDNMTLCLVNGERIKLRHEMRCLFEVADLSVASPATVSRCGMVFLSQELGFLPYVKSWLPKFEQMPPELEAHLYKLFEEKLPAGLAFIRANAREPIPTVDIQVATSLCALFEALFTSANGVDLSEPLDDLRLLVELLFAFSFAWAVGGALDTDGVRQFSKFCMEQFVNVRPPVSMFDSYVDVREKSWKSWDAIVPAFEFDAKMPYFSMIVPTIDTVRYQNLLTTLLNIEKPVFWTGQSGVGKSELIANLLNKENNSESTIGGAGSRRLNPLCLTFSGQTNARKTQETIEGKLVKYRKTLLGAPAGSQVVIFVDDVNMPQLQEYGAQPPIELLRQFLDYRGFYCRDKLFWKSIADTTLVCAAAPPGGGRNALTARFTRHFNIFNLPAPSESVMKKIFSSILGGFLNAFKAGVQKLRDPIVASTVELYEAISKELLPTPAKSHYTFNLRDISKVFQGILMVKPVSVQTPETATKLWIHEAQRCFADRLICDEDRLWFSRKLTNLVNKQFGLAWTHEELFEREEKIMWGDWYRPGLEKQYELDTKGKQVALLLDEYLDEYNLGTQNKQNLVFFADAIEHISRIVRVLRQPRGNLMLVGVGGSGKQSLTRLACFMSEMKCCELEISRGFGYSDFQEHLKKMMVLAGVGGRETVFLFTENQIVEERMLEDVSGILNSGEVPNLFPQDELVKIIDDLTPVVRDMGLPASRAVVYAQFVQRVRDKLHIVLCMSPIGESFRVRCRQFPSLISCCTIDWFTKWDASALHSVATRFLKDLDLPSEEVRQSLVNLCVEFQSSMEDACERFYGELRRRVYTTPKSYLDLINLYLSVLAERRNQLGTQRQHLLTGLSKLIETKSVVAELREQLTALKPTLIEKSRETEAMLAQVSIDNEKADKVKAVVEVEEQEVATRTEEVREVQADAQADLDLALPALRSAIKALDKLKKAEISEVKSMANPPSGVVRTMEAVCILLGVQPDWENSKRLLSKVDFLKMLKDYDKDHVDPRAIKKLQKYIQDPELTEERMANVSRAAASILTWVMAIVDYSAVAKVVAPKRARVEQMNALLQEANDKLAVKQRELQDVVDRVQALKAKCEATLQEKIALDAKSTQTEKRLERAQKLTTGLASEEIRWARDAEDIGLKLVDLVGNAFISAACISYYGPFTAPYRAQLVSTWHRACLESRIPTSVDFSLVSTLGNPVEIRGWEINGLPAVFADSGILVKRSFRWPLAVDPQEQAKKWIKNEHRNKLMITKFSSKDMLKTVENAVKTGSPLLIEDIGESLDAAIDPILLKQIYVKGEQKYVRLGDTEVEYNDKFRLYLTCKMSNPHYLPEQQIKITLMNFSITRSGLEEQLLGDVLKKEAFEIEEKRNKSIAAMAKDRKSLNDIEDRILLLLSESSGNILDDENLIDTLEESKFTSTLIQGRMQDGVVTQQIVSATREKYRSVAQRGSVLYFAMADLALIDTMYQYSLSYFLRLFSLCIDQAAKSDDLAQRLDNLMAHITASVFTNISRGLFENHKLLFAFSMCTALFRESGEISDGEWGLLLRDGSSSVDKKKMQAITESMMPNPLPEQIDAPSWKFLTMLEHLLPAFKGLVGDMLISSAKWRAWMQSADPQNTALPGAWEGKLTSFQKLLVLKALRFEKLLFATRDFVSLKMGPSFVNGAQASLEEVYRDTDRTTPVIFVLSQGADPTALLLRFAKEKKYEERLNVISLGQGQGDNAARMIEQARQHGHWVLLQNCHLSKSWMPSLEEIVESFSNDDSGSQRSQHPDFRLWLTSMPCDYFPVSVLQKGVKLTNEPPTGIRANLVRSYHNVINGNDFETVHPTSKSAPFKKLMFSLSFFHAVIQERKKFGSIGWNKSYEFNDSDLETSIQVLRQFLEEQEAVPWDALRYVVGQINYGGRVTDDLDRRCLMSILGKFFKPDILADNYAFMPEMIDAAAPVPLIDPRAGRYEDVCGWIQSVPLPSLPLGMHENANLTFQRNSSTSMIATLLSVQPREIVSASGVSSDTVVASMALDLEERMPQQLDRKRAGAETFKVSASGVMDSLGTVLLQEVERFNRLLDVMKVSLRQVQAAIKGEVVMSGELDKMYSSLLNNQVPDVWARVAYPSLKPLASWVADLHARIAFMHEWLVTGPPNSFCLSYFYFPQGFMTGALQNHSRKYKIPIDTLNFAFRVLDVYERREVEQPPEDGIYIDGLFLDGARWDDERRALADSRLGELTANMPIIWFLPTDEPQQHDPAAEYSCPVYKTSVRAGVLSTTGQSTNYVLSVDLPINNDETYFVLKGAALLCQLDV